MTQNPPGKSTGGVLQIPAAATQKNANTTSKKAPRPAAPRLKLLVRRLPPGLTETEFEKAVGFDWKVGAGKVDWLQFKPGKVSKDPAKPSRPSRAYIRVVSSDYIAPLSERIHHSSFVDARNTVNDPVLLGPPSLEFAPFAKIPGSRVRKDARQGTIDQDPDFFAFLESLTQPITKPTNVETTTAEGEEKQEAAPVTPLIQYIREKKANKAKEIASPAKAGKHGKAEKETKPEKGQAKKKLLQRTDKEPPPPQPAEKKSKADKATKDAVKIANKQASSVTSKSGSKAPASSSTTTTTTQNTTKDTASPGPGPDRSKRERTDASAAVKIVQRELAHALAGGGGGGGRRKGGKGASQEADAPKAEQPSGKASTTPETSKKEIASKKPTKRATASPNNNATAKGSGSNIVSHPAEHTSPDPGTPSTRPAPASARPPPKSAKGKQQPSVPMTSQATQAFLKHANPSQGITEPILESTFKTFGRISKVEIDRKKGFGYIDFAEPEGLQKAIAASPVVVAQGQVVVLERKANPGADRARGKGRNETPPSNNNSNNSNNSNARGGKASGGAETAAGGGSVSSSRGPRGGRGGPKNRGGGSKNSGGSNTPSGGEKTGGLK